MIEHKASWEDVQPGHFIKDKVGRIWKVDEISAGKVHMNRGGNPGAITMPEPLAPVTIAILNTQEMIELTLEAEEVSS